MEFQASLFHALLGIEDPPAFGQCSSERADVWGAVFHGSVWLSVADPDSPAGFGVNESDVV